MIKYQIFTRTWWRENPTWPNGLEPCAGRKRNITICDTPEQAREYCRRQNARLPKSGRQARLGFKFEFESI